MSAGRKMPRLRAAALMAALRRAGRRFRAEERASLSIETVVIFPLLVWCYLGMYTFFDGFRSQSLSDKAVYTIADMVSRETNYITPEYITTLYQIHGMMTNDRNPTKLRLTIIRWDEADSRYEAVWSERRGGAPELTPEQLAAPEYRDRLPDGLPDGERLILLESWTLYEPPFDLGRTIDWAWSGNFGGFQFETFTVTRPRFAAQVCWNSVEGGDASTATC